MNQRRAADGVLEAHSPRQINPDPNESAYLDALTLLVDAHRHLTDMHEVADKPEALANRIAEFLTAHGVVW